MMLIVAMAFMTTGCNDTASQKTQAETVTETDVKTDVLGEGKTSFAFAITDADGLTTNYEIRTDKETIGEALLELGLIDGEDSEYGLFVKTVGNITVDYDKDGKYWAFYVDGEYATTGVDTTPITPGASYSFKVEK